MVDSPHLPPDRRGRRTVWLHAAAFLGFLGFTTSYAAGQAPPATAAAAPATTASELPFPIFGPAPPIAPATSVRDELGRLTIRATRLTTPLNVDGVLDDAVYAQVPPVTGFVQLEPDTGAPATQKTEFWIFYDDKNVYAVVRAWESNLKGMIANEMRRDNNAMTQNEYVNFVLDTFYDRRNAQTFVVTPTGGRMDGQVTNESQYNGDWNPVWLLKAGRFDGGWTAEAVIPFKSLRYRPTRTQVWGLHVSRFNRWKNEIDFPIVMPRAKGLSASFLMSQAPTLVGIEAPPAGHNLEIKPYAISNLTTDRIATPRVSNDLSGDVGGDVKYGITQSLFADATVNTDFAQVEADEQQVNLTRFSLFFPEKRDFFLENRDTFSFGGVATTAGGDAPVLFYSRRIGLSGAQIVPIGGGGRLSGRSGRLTIGVLDMQSKKDEAIGVASTNFGVVRIKRDILRRSSIGALFTRRSVSERGTGSNEAYGVDGTFSFFSNLNLNASFARTPDDRNDTSYRAILDYAGDRYAVQAERLGIGARFNPEIGYVRRNDIEKTAGLFRFSPRPTRWKSVRKLTYQGTVSYIENAAGREEWRDLAGTTAVEFQNSDKVTLDVNNTYEYVPVPFRIAQVTVPIGGYQYNNARLSLALGQQRSLSGTVTIERGSLYDGTKTAVGLSKGRIKLRTQLSVEPSFSINHIELPQGTTDTNLVGSRITYTATPLMFVSALVQFNSATHSVAANVRLRWEYQPGSELFVVYNDQRDTRLGSFPELTNRAFIIKVNRLFRF